MAFLAPALGAILGGVAATAVGQAVIGLGLSLGLGYLARRLQPEADTSARGMRLSLRLEPNSPREIGFGEFASAGTLEYHNTYGPNGNDYVQLVYAIADHECDGLVSVFVDGVPCALGAYVSTADVNGFPVVGFEDCLWLQFHSGAFDQTADADLVSKSSNGEWSSTERGAGVAYVRATIKANPEKFKSGQPRLLFVVRGIKLYDVRKDSTAGGSGSHRWGVPSTYEYTRNPIICAYNYRRGIFVGGSKLGGMNATVAALPVAAWAAAANVCDELVALKAGGTEKRYQMSGVVPVNADHRTVLRDMITAAGGVDVDSGGVFKPYAGAALSPVMTITDGDLMPGAVQYVPKLSRTGLVNAVFGTYQSPAQKYEATALPPRISSADAESDGGSVLQEHYGLSFVTSGTQGQRITEILRRKNRYQRTVACRLRSRFAVLEVGDWVTWSSDRYGFNGTFEIAQATLERDLSISVELREIAADVFSWVPGLDELDPLSPVEVGSGGTRLSVVEDVALANITITGAGDEQRPGLRVTWQPITDITVLRLDLEYRKVGDTVALERQIVNAGAGSYDWLDGVQGGITYEARLKPVTLPERATTWSAWVAVPAAAAPQIVSLAAEALYIDPENIPPAELSAQSAFELALVTARENIRGSVSNQVAELRVDLERVAQSIMSTAAFQTRQMQSVRRTIDGQTVTVTELLEVTEGLSGSWTVQVDVDGRVVAAARLDGSETTSAFTVLAENFVVADPAHPDVTPFVVTPEGILLDGVVVRDGTVSASALNAATLSTLYISDPDGTFFYNFTTGQQGATDGSFLIDARNKMITATSVISADFRYIYNSMNVAVL